MVGGFLSSRDLAALTSTCRSLRILHPHQLQSECGTLAELGHLSRHWGAAEQLVTYMTADLDVLQAGVLLPILRRINNITSRLCSLKLLCTGKHLHATDCALLQPYKRIFIERMLKAAAASLIHLHVRTLTLAHIPHLLNIKELKLEASGGFADAAMRAISRMHTLHSLSLQACLPWWVDYVPVSWLDLSGMPMLENIALTNLALEGLALPRRCVLALHMPMLALGEFYEDAAPYLHCLQSFNVHDSEAPVEAVLGSASFFSLTHVELLVHVGGQAAQPVHVRLAHLRSLHIVSGSDLHLYLHEFVLPERLVLRAGCALESDTGDLSLHVEDAAALSNVLKVFSIGYSNCRAASIFCRIAGRAAHCGCAFTSTCAGHDPRARAHVQVQFLFRAT